MVSYRYRRVSIGKTLYARSKAECTTIRGQIMSQPTYLLGVTNGPTRQVIESNTESPIRHYKHINRSPKHTAPPTLGLPFAAQTLDNSHGWRRCRESIEDGFWHSSSEFPYRKPDISRNSEAWRSTFENYGQTMFTTVTVWEGECVCV